MTISMVQVLAVSRWEALGFGVIVGAILFGSGVLVDSVARRGADGSLPRNKVAGIRSNATMASDEAWLAAHTAGERPTRAGAWASMVGGAVAVVVGVLAGFDWMEADRAMLISTVAIAGAALLLVVLVIFGGMQGNRAARAVTDA